MPGFAPAQITAEDLALAVPILTPVASQQSPPPASSTACRPTGPPLPGQLAPAPPAYSLLAELRHLRRRYGQPAEPLEPDCVLDIDAAGLRALRVLPPALRARPAVHHAVRLLVRRLVPATRQGSAAGAEPVGPGSSGNRGLVADSAAMPQASRPGRRRGLRQ